MNVCSSRSGPPPFDPRLPQGHWHRPRPGSQPPLAALARRLPRSPPPLANPARLRHRCRLRPPPPLAASARLSRLLAPLVAHLIALADYIYILPAVVKPIIG